MCASVELLRDGSIELAEIAQFARLEMSWKLITSVVLWSLIILLIHVVRCQNLDRRLIICHFDLVDVVVNLVNVLGVDNILGFSLSCKLQLLLEVLAVVKVLNVVVLDVVVGLILGLLTCRRMAVPSLPKSKNRILLLRSHVLIFFIDWQDVVA